MPIGPVLRPRGRHAKPTRTSQPLLAGLLAASLGGPLAALAASSASAADAPAEAVLARSSLTGSLPLVEDRALVRASRARTAEQAPVEAPPVVPPPPSPPPPVPAALPGCTSRATAQYANGRIPESALCSIPGHSGHRLRADAARALVTLSAAYKAETGRSMCITDTYRSYSAQAALKRQKGRLAATPGRSNHGTGIAVDFCGGIESFGTSSHRWMKQNAGRFGWVHPSWAGRGGAKPEPWHWEYRG